MNIKFATILLLSIFSLYSPLVIGRNSQDIAFDTQIEQAQESFENVYYELVKKGHFGDFYNNNMIIDSSPNFSFSAMGPILLNLIDWLETKNDFDSYFLLKKINKLFCYQLHRYTCKMEVPKNIQATMWNAYHELFKYKTTSSQNFHIHPFRTCLAKAMIYLFSVKYSGLIRTEKIESLVYYLEKLKEETIKINESFGNKQLEKTIILDFMNNLEAYAINDPLVKPRSVRRMALIAVIVLPIIIGSGWLAFKNWPIFWNWVKNQAGELTRAMGREFTEGAFESQNLRNAENRVQGNINNIRNDVQNVTSDANGLLDRTNNIIQRSMDNMNQTVTAQLNNIQNNTIPAAVDQINDVITNQVADLRNNTIPHVIDDALQRAQQAANHSLDDAANRNRITRYFLGGSTQPTPTSPPQDTATSDTGDTTPSTPPTSDSQPGYLRQAARYLNPRSYLKNNSES